MTSIFKRYADGGTSDRHIHMPQRVLPTTVSHSPLEVLVGHWEKYLVAPSSLREQFPWAARFVMGMPVTTWARGLEWNLGQKSRFISAVWSGGDLGSYLTNDWAYRSIGLSLQTACSGKIGVMTSPPNLDHLTPEQLRALAAQLMQRVESLD